MDLRRARSDARLRARIARPLLVVLAALALLGTGGWDAPRPGAASSALVAGPSALTVPAGPAGADRMPLRAMELRAVLLAAVPAPLSAPDAAPPERVGLAVSQLRSAGADDGAAAAPTGPTSSSSSRAPPGTAGTDATLPTRP